jgi:hypothetical protein
MKLKKYIAFFPACILFLYIVNNISTNFFEKFLANIFVSVNLN